MADAESRTLTIANKRGLHARAAAKFVRVVAQFDAAVRVAHGGQEVSGLSIMGLMMLAAAIGSQIQVSATGAQAAAALDALATLVNGRFGED
ncbi:MAG TPA: HPr family phosphocarrier protein [Vineibacter sp.]|nr:HPr family phosphocarrier protein [Vineibacter sp.]